MTSRTSALPRRLLDPEWEPSDEELKELAERAWTATAPTHGAALRLLEFLLIREVEEVKRRLEH